MAVCTLKFYRTNITPDKNRCYDQRGNLSLLGTMASATLIYTKENFQYQKISLRMSIKVSFSQNVQYYQNVNYLSLWDVSTQREYFFYIIKFEWMAQNTIKCELYLDTIQTFRHQILDKITASTYVMREHSDRAKALTGGGFQRIISKTDEGVGVVSQELQNYGSLSLQNSKQDHKGYVAYAKGVEDDSPISVLYFSDGDFDVIKNDTPLTDSISITNLSIIDVIAPPDKYNGFIITQEDSPDFKMWNNDTTITPFGEEKTINGEKAICRAIYFANSNNTASGSYGTLYKKIFYTGSKYPYVYVEDNDPPERMLYPYKIANFIYLRKIPEVFDDIDLNYFALNNRFSSNEIAVYECGSNFRNVKLATKSTFDFTDSFLMKVVEIPFFPPVFRDPATPVMDNRLPVGFYFDFHYKCLRKASLSDDVPVVPYNAITIGSNASFHVYPNTMPKQIANESKLFNSSFYTCKFVYGADSKDIKLENINATSISITGYAPSNMSSTILFDFHLNTGNYKGLDDYFSYLTTTRNNERPVYNSSYLDYMRMQYTSDRANLKQSQDQKIASLAGSITTSAVSTGASILGGAMVGASAGSGGGPIGAVIGGVAGLIASSISVGLSIYNTNNAIAQENRNYSTKLGSIVAQNVSLSGNVDIDILDKMNKNSLNIYLYQAPDHIRQQLFDKFYYTGYAVGYRKMPDFTSRHNFNFVQCVPVFNNSEMFVAKEFLDDIMERFASGVTFMHPVSIDGVMATFDENQLYENMEVSLL